MTVIPTASAAPIPRWPLFIAPLLALAYYSAVQDGFGTAIRDVIPNASDLGEAIGGMVHPRWGVHWIYRTFAELVSVGLATFIAAGFARERARTAAMIGGCAISLFYALRLALLIWTEQHVPESIIVPEPWYQYAIEGGVVLAAPLVGVYLSEGAMEISTKKPYGFGGIPRLHFLWLWFPLYWYSAAMIGPIMRTWLSDIGNFGILGSIYTIANLIPAAIFAVPLFAGLMLLSGETAQRWHPAMRHTAGVIVLMVGFAIATAIHLGLIWFVNLF